MSDMFQDPEWDGESYCVVRNCHQPARFEKPWGMSGPVPIVEMVCEYHRDVDE